MRLVWTAMLLGLIVAASPVSAQAPPPPAGEVLRKVAETHTNVTRFHLVATTTFSLRRSSDGAVVNEKTLLPAETALQLPDQVHVTLATGEPKEASTIFSDGKQGWIFLPERNQYLSVKPGAAPAKPMAEMAVTEATAVPYGVQIAQKALAGFQIPASAKASILRTETVATSGGSIACYVMKIEGLLWPDSVSTWWVDQKRFVVLRDDMESNSRAGTDIVSTVYDVVQVNEPIPESVFQFTPPPDAKRVTSMRR